MPVIADQIFTYCQSFVTKFALTTTGTTTTGATTTGNTTGASSSSSAAASAASKATDDQPFPGDDWAIDLLIRSEGDAAYHLGRMLAALTDKEIPVACKLCFRFLAFLKNHHESLLEAFFTTPAATPLLDGCKRVGWISEANWDNHLKKSLTEHMSKFVAGSQVKCRGKTINVAGHIAGINMNDNTHLVTLGNGKSCWGNIGNLELVGTATVNINNTDNVVFGMDELSI